MKEFTLPNYIRALYYISQLRRHQWLKEEELAKIQEKKLRAIVKHAHQNVPFYRELYDSVGIKPEDIESTEDLRKIPIITKKDVQKNYPDKMIANGVDINRCGIGRTSGSTGIALEICSGLRTIEYSQALLGYAFFESGLKLTDKLVNLTHPHYKIINTWFRKLGILRKENVSLHQSPEVIIEALKKAKPDVIYSYPSILFLLAKEIEDKGISGIRPRMIITNGETLTDYVKKKIGDAFYTEVYDTYGTAEFMRLAFECQERSGYHIITDCAVVEFIKDGKNVDAGEPGEIVVTGLYNYEMPLIRYNLDDIGTSMKEKCACGRGFPLMGSIEGKVDDFLIMPSGRTISPKRLVWLERIPGIGEHRTIQKEKDRFIVQVVKGKGFSKETISQIKQHIKLECLPDNVRVEVKLVEEIPREKHGKLKRIVSEVATNHGLHR